MKIEEGIGQDFTLYTINTQGISIFVCIKTVYFIVNRVVLRVFIIIVDGYKYLI